jgi:hypothetical protein
VKLKPERHTAPNPALRLRLVSLYDTVEPGQPPVEGRTSRENKGLSHTPGGRQAQKDGCTCPLMHDKRGDITVYVDGHPMMLIREGCPVHTPLARQDRPEHGERGVFRHTGRGVTRAAFGPDKPPKDKNKEPPDAEPAP